MTLDLIVAAVTAVAWLGAGTVAAMGRARLATVLLAGAVLITLARFASVWMLSGRGWWFVEEKALVGLPLLGVAALSALALTVRRGFSRASTVSVLATGYAAVSGLGLTLLSGSPLAWGSALITVALAAGATLVTWRVLSPAAPDEIAGPSRRRFLGIAGGAVVAGAGVAGAGLAFVPADALDTGGGPAGVPGHRHGRPVTGLRGPTAPELGGAVRRHVLTARKAMITLPSGRRIEAWTYNGEVPGPTIRAARGDLIEVTLRNKDIEEGVTLHWHGYELPCGEDGAPGLTQAAVFPGDEFTYRFRADQTGTFWYHTHQVSHRGVRLGLYGSLIVGADSGPGDLAVPFHIFEGEPATGHPEEIRMAPGSPVRLRLTNTENKPHMFALTGAEYRLAAVDGRDLNRPGDLDRVGLRLAAGGRYDLAFTMPDGPVALTADGEPRMWLLPPGASTGKAEDTSGWPELDLMRYGAPAPPPFGRRFDRNFTLVLDRGIARVDGVPTFAQTVNARGFPHIPDQLVRKGDLVRLTVVNRSLETHPWHLHGHTVHVLTRDGEKPAGSPLRHDTFDVRPGEVWQVAFRADNPGLWMHHCHDLEHAKDGMMLHLAYDGITTPFH